MSLPRVLITRRVPEAGLRVLEGKVDMDIFEEDRPISREELLHRVSGIEGLYCLLSDRIDGEVIEAAGDQLQIIANYAVGYNNIDVDLATEKGILVTNTPGALREATADLTWALLMAVARKIPQSDRFVREGRYLGWGPKLMLGYPVQGMTIGIVGMGDIGAAVARRAMGFDMRILYNSRSPKPDIEGEVGAERADMDRLLRESDFITLHVPLTPETMHLMGERELEMMKETAVLVNMARGEVIDEKALVSALKDGSIGGAGLDVYENEPSLSPGLSDLENVVLTPHTGSATFPSRDTMAIMAAENLLAGLEGRRPKNLVNPSILEGK